MAPNKHAPDTANLILAVVLSLLIFSGWEYFVEVPRKKAEVVALQAKSQADLQLAQAREKEAPITPKTRSELVAEAPRLPIKSDQLHGSLSLKGLRFDDLTLAKYHETLAPNSPEVTLFSPAGDAKSYFAEFGWLSDNASLKLPNADSVWAADSKEIVPQKPVTLTWNNGAGVTFKVIITLDNDYMFTLEESAKDASSAPVTLQSYALINRVYDLKHATIGTSHEGPLGIFDGTLQEATYKKLTTEPEPQKFETQTGWLGITDKYWLAAIAPVEENFTSHFSYYAAKDRDHFQADYQSAPETATTLHLFAGAKKNAILDDYSQRYNIPNFDRAVDFGRLWLIARPLFKALNYFYTLVGNFGVAIVILTIVVKSLMFPLANKSFKSMNQMKTLHPKMTEIRERHKNDKLKLNQEIMELYKREKINPAGGCLPLLIQIPVSLALLNVLYVTLEMRHAPFFGWIHDLSASDPTNLFTLFGLAPWGDPIFPTWVPMLGGAHLHVGLWPIITCITMAIVQRQSPPPPDPVQAKVIKLMPLFLLFVFAPLPAGVMIYWACSNIFTILQQWYITSAYAAEQQKKKTA